MIGMWIWGNSRMKSNVSSYWLVMMTISQGQLVPIYCNALKVLLMVDWFTLTKNKLTMFTILIYCVIYIVQI